MRVLAVNAVGQSAPSNEVVVQLPPQPTTLVASFQLFDLSSQSGATSECRLRAPNNSTPITCTLRSTSFATGTNTIQTYTWHVTYTHGTVVNIDRVDTSPTLTFSDVCDSPTASTAAATTGWRSRSR